MADSANDPYLSDRDRRKMLGFLPDPGGARIQVGTPPDHLTPVGRLFPHYPMGSFVERWAVWDERKQDLERGDYGGLPEEWFRELSRALRWEAFAGLFGPGAFAHPGTFDPARDADGPHPLCELNALGEATDELTRDGFSRPRTVGGWAILQRPPAFAFRSPPRVAYPSPPILDLTTDPPRWHPPYQPGPGWEAGSYASWARHEFRGRDIPHTIAATLAGGSPIDAVLGQAIIVRRPAPPDLTPAAVLGRAVAIAWRMMRDITFAGGLTPPVPEEPGEPDPQERIARDARSRIRNWLQAVRHAHPTFYAGFLRSAGWPADGLPPDVRRDQSEGDRKGASLGQGPYAHGCFRWGKGPGITDIPTDQWRLLELLFDGARPRDIVADEDLMRCLYGITDDDDTHPLEKAFGSLYKRLRETLKESGQGTIVRPRKAGGIRYGPPAD